MSVLDNFKLDGQVAVVTGAGRGIGRGIALALAEAGADVVVAARRQDDIDEVAGAIEKLGRRALAVQTDVTNEASMERLLTKARDAFGGISIWVNNAGGNPTGKANYLTRTPMESWDAQMDLNLKAVWIGSVLAAKEMKDSGGVIINTSSRASFGPSVKNGPYGASKAAVNSLTQTLSREVAPNVRVNAVAPGPVPTDNFDDCMNTDTDEARENLRQMMNIPLQRYGTVDDIGAAVVFMCSPASSWITGQCLYVTGGL